MMMMMIIMIMIMIIVIIVIINIIFNQFRFQNVSARVHTVHSERCREV